MTIYLNTIEYDDKCEITWATATSSVGGVYTLSIPPTQDRIVLAEIAVLYVLLARYPGKAGSVETSCARLKKVFRGDDCFARTEIVTLSLMYPRLKIDTHKNTRTRCVTAYSLVVEKKFEEAVWGGIGRPILSTSIGLLEITDHAMQRYRERFSPSSDLKRLSKLLNRQAFKIDDSIKDGKPCEIYSIPETGIRFVVVNESDRRRIMTFYGVS